MRYLLLLLLFTISSGKLLSQNTGNTITGKVSYISSQNVYVKFESTKNISAGDTLFIFKENKLIPAMIVTNLSSTSCVCTPISAFNITMSLQVIAKNKEREKPVMEEIIKKEQDGIKKEKIITPNDTALSEADIKNKENGFKEKITGSISASSYSYFSNTSSVNSNRYQYHLSLNVLNIASSRFSAESYISFRHQQNKWELVQDNIFHALKIYSLSVKYDITKNTNISFGRKINPKISSIGAVDGLQFETKINNFYLGAIAGSRPNYTDYSFDSNLPQLGAYIAHYYKTPSGELQNSFGFIEQMNSGKTDRRFAYFQHSNSLLKNVYFFGSLELDLYKKLNDKVENTLDLSSTYLSLNYRMFRWLSFSASYDSRKNVIYYESYKSFINQILEIEARQGMSFQVTYNSLKNISIGIKTGYRFQNSNSKESRNIYGFISYSNIPLLKATITGSATFLETTYIIGNIYNLNISRDLFKGSLYLDCGYQYVDYGFSGFETTLVQNIANISISWRFYKKFTFSTNFEETFEGSDRYSRLNLQLRKRF